MSKELLGPDILDIQLLLSVYKELGQSLFKAKPEWQFTWPAWVFPSIKMGCILNLAGLSWRWETKYESFQLSLAHGKSWEDLLYGIIFIRILRLVLFICLTSKGRGWIVMGNNRTWSWVQNSCPFGWRKLWRKSEHKPQQLTILYYSPREENVGDTKDIFEACQEAAVWKMT